MKKIIILIAGLFMAYVAFSQNNFYAKTIFWNDAKHRDSLFIQGPADPVAGYYLKCVNDSGYAVWAPVTADTSSCSDTLFTGKYVPDTSQGQNVNSIDLDSAIYSVAGNIVTVSGLIRRLGTDGPTQRINLSLPVTATIAHDYDLTGVVSSTAVGTGWLIKGDTATNEAVLFLGNDTIPGGFITYTFSYWIPDNITQCVPCNISGGGGGSDSSCCTNFDENVTNVVNDLLETYLDDGVLATPDGPAGAIQYRQDNGGGSGGRLLGNGGFVYVQTNVPYAGDTLLMSSSYVTDPLVTELDTLIMYQKDTTVHFKSNRAIVINDGLTVYPNGGVQFYNADSATIYAISSPQPGTVFFCTDCTASDNSTGVLVCYNGALWKREW